MTPINTPLLNTNKLESFALFLRNDCNKITDALFVENLISAIDKHPGSDKSCVERWLQRAFEFPKNFENYNCIDTYNLSFYHQLIDKL